MLPERYRDPWLERGITLALDRLRPGDSVLDIGGSERPSLPVEQRPAGITYVGLDPDAALARGAYDERITGDIDARDPALAERFEMALSWNTMEHVADVTAAFANVYDYLKPGGMLVALFSGRWAAFAVASRLMPHAARVELMRRFMNEKPEEHFPTRYDHCSYRHLVRILSTWSEPVIVPLYRGGLYFEFSPALQRFYLAYENWALSRPNLATHYLVSGRRSPATARGRLLPE